MRTDHGLAPLAPGREQVTPPSLLAVTDSSLNSAWGAGVGGGGEEELDEEEELEEEEVCRSPAPPSRPSPCGSSSPGSP